MVKWYNKVTSPTGRKVGNTCLPVTFPKQVSSEKVIAMENLNITCPKCGNVYPPTKEYFYFKKDKITLPCKECRKAYQKEYREKNPEKSREAVRRWRRENPEKSEQSSQSWKERNYEQWYADYYPKNRDRMIAYSREYKKNNKDRLYQRQLKYRSERKERYRELTRKSYRKNKAKYVSQNKQYRKRPEVKKRQADYMRVWTQENRDKVKVIAIRREARKRELPDTFTVEQWQFALNYFNGCCAVCGRQLHDLFGTHTAAADHWIPLSYEGEDNPGTVATNIVPLCHGEDGCNNSKRNLLPDVWLVSKFGKRDAVVILARVNTYFDSIKSIFALQE